MKLLDAMEQILNIVHDQTNVRVEVVSVRGVEFTYYIGVDSYQFLKDEPIKLVHFPANDDFQLRNMESVLRELLDKMPVISHRHFVGNVDAAEFKACAEEWTKHPNIAVALFAKYFLKCADWESNIEAQMKLVKKALKDAPDGWKFEIIRDGYLSRYSGIHLVVQGTNSITGFAGEFGKITVHVRPNGFDICGELERNLFGTNCSIKSILKSQGLI